MTGYINASLIVGATVSVLTYMHLNFASAADMSELKEIVVTATIQRMMWDWCKESDRADLKHRIEADRADFARDFHHPIEWVCTPR